MRLPYFPSSWSFLPATAVLAFALAAVTGCSFDPSQSPSIPVSANIAGVIHGGPNPIAGATVKLYATQTNGYGGAGTVLATTMTSSTGAYSFNAASYSCPSGQQAYITAAGGNTGANTANSNSLLMAAIGPCSSLTPNTYVWIDELSTVAAAYALSNFITVSGSGASAVVGVSAPASNNAASGSCTGTGAAMTCQAAGLAHAFLNAANLVNAVGTTSAPPTGQAYFTPISNPTPAGTAVGLQNVVPQQLINTLGNIVQACVNTTGVTGGSDTTSGCGQFFTNTTVPTTYSSNATFTTKPTNTLQALVNLAKFPFMTSGSVTNLYNIAAGSGYYQPTLTAAPPDFSIAIIYRSYSSTNNQIGSVYYTTTDINDNVYATALTATSTGTAVGSVPLIAQSLSSDGVGNWTGPAQISSSSGNLCSVYGGTAATSGPCEAATDAAGHLYVGLGSLSFTTGGLFQVNTSTAAVTPITATTTGSTPAIYPVALAVDRNNNLFYSTAVNGASNLYELAAGSSATSTPVAVATGGATFSGAHLSDSLVFDASGNLFAPLASGSNVGYNFLTNTGTLSAEAFATTANQCNCLGTGTVGIDKWPTGGMVDGSGNFWMTGQYGVFEITSSSGSTAAANAQAATGGGSAGVNSFAIGSSSSTTLRISSMDGAGTIFVPDSSGGGAQNPAPPPTEPSPVLRVYYTGLAAQASIASCNTGGVTGNTACITSNAGAPNNQLFYQAINPAIDSTGSMWISSEGNDAIIQILGFAAPTWPQASYLHPGVMPQ